MLLRAATYNIHKCRGLDGRTRPERVAAVLAELNADIIGLQEVVRGEGEGAIDQAEFLRAALGDFHLAFGETRKQVRAKSGVPYGNAVLSRFPIVESARYDLTWRGRERRGCLRVDLDAGAAGVLHVFNAHLGTAFLERRHQGRRLVSAEVLGREFPGPKLVMGDFNEWTRGLATHLLAVHFKALQPKRLLGHARSYPGVLPFLHLDHIYYDRALRLESMRLHRSRLALVASDHVPLVAEFEVEARQQQAASNS